MDREKLAEAIVMSGAQAGRETSVDHDPTEIPRRIMQAVLNADQSPRAELEARYGKCWDTSELSREFDVIGFMAPFVVAVKRDTGERGSLEFRHAPRLYFNWQPDRR